MQTDTRTDDPPTSHAAGDAATRDVTPAHARILALLIERNGTDTQLIRRWAVNATRSVEPWPFISDSGLRSRRAELVDLHLVEPSGEHGTTKANKPTQEWRIAAGARAELNLLAAEYEGNEAKLPQLSGATLRAAKRQLAYAPTIRAVLERAW